jgi:uncharacterized protein YndB with AHSA1/START domain
VEVDRSAPARAADEAEIAADPETVWEVLAGFERWPAWNPDVRSVELQGEAREGTVFRWKAGRATITSRIERMERPRLLGWTGRTAGIEAVHVWRLEPRAGGTFARTEESWDGLPVRLLRGPLRRALQKAVAGGLVHLKAEAERRARRGD